MAFPNRKRPGKPPGIKAKLTLRWIASAFHASQRRAWRNFAQQYNHHRHGEAHSAAAI